MISEFNNINHRDFGLREITLDNLKIKQNEYYSKNTEFLEFRNFNFKYGKKHVLDIDQVKIPNLKRLIW